MKLKVTEGVFEATKALLKQGVTHKKCAEYMGIGLSTVSSIGKAETYEQYKLGGKKEEKVDNPAPPATEQRQTVVLAANQYVMEELKMQTDLLKTISAKLAMIIDDLYGTRTEKGSEVTEDA